MLEQYKTIYEGGIGEIVEEKIQISGRSPSGKIRGRGFKIY